MRRWWVLLISIFFLVLMVWLGLHSFSEEQPPRKTKVTHVKYERFLMLEGSTIQSVLAKLSSVKSVTHDLPQSASRLMQALGLGSRSPEGLFFPDTYFYHSGSSDKAVLLLAYKKMQSKLANCWAMRSPRVAYKTAYEALIVASLIEKEAANNRPLVSAVINNRLRKGMRLQIDSALVYGLHLPYGVPITHAMLKKKTPYNTYRLKGLPPTPIALPSLSSLQAACRPAHSKALYYVVGDDGKHHFSETYRRHKRAVKALRIREARRKSMMPALTSLGCFSGVLMELLITHKPHSSMAGWVCTMV